MLDIQEVVTELVEAAGEMKTSGKFSKATLNKTYNAIDRLNQATEQELTEATSALGGSGGIAILLTGVLLSAALAERKSAQAATASNEESGYALSDC